MYIFFEGRELILTEIDVCSSANANLCISESKDNIMMTGFYRWFSKIFASLWLERM